MNGRITLRLTNSLQVPRTVVLEPWTGEYTLAPGKSFDIVADGDLSMPLEVEAADDRLIVYSLDSQGAMLTIYSEGKELLRSE